MSNSNDLKQHHQSRWLKMIEIEPHLTELYGNAKAEADQLRAQVQENRLDADTFDYYENYKSRLKKLVGWTAKNKSLATTQDYDAAHWFIFEDSGLMAALGDFEEAVEQRHKK